MSLCLISSYGLSTLTVLPCVAEALMETMKRFIVADNDDDDEYLLNANICTGCDSTLVAFHV